MKSGSGSGSGPTGRPQNIAGAALHVEAMPSTVMEMTKSTFTNWAKLMTAPDENSTLIDRQYVNREYEIVGKVTTLTGADAGWYMVRHEGGRVGYMRTKYF